MKNWERNLGRGATYLNGYLKLSWDDTGRKGRTSRGESLSGNTGPGTSLVVQWLGLHAFTAGNSGSTPGQGTKILYTVWTEKEGRKYRC